MSLLLDSKDTEVRFSQLNNDKEFLESFIDSLLLGNGEILQSSHGDYIYSSFSRDKYDYIHSFLSQHNILSYFKLNREEIYTLSHFSVKEHKDRLQQKGALKLFYTPISQRLLSIVLWINIFGSRKNNNCLIVESNLSTNFFKLFVEILNKNFNITVTSSNGYVKLYRAENLYTPICNLTSIIHCSQFINLLTRKEIKNQVYTGAH